MAFRLLEKSRLSSLFLFLFFLASFDFSRPILHLLLCSWSLYFAVARARRRQSGVEQRKDTFPFSQEAVPFLLWLSSSFLFRLLRFLHSLPFLSSSSHPFHLCRPPFLLCQPRKGLQPFLFRLSLLTPLLRFLRHSSCYFHLLESLEIGSTPVQARKVSIQRRNSRENIGASVKIVLFRLAGNRL